MFICVHQWLKNHACLTARHALSVALALPLLLALPACKPRETNVESGNRTQTLHRGMGPALANLDPHLATGTTDYNVLSALFEGLIAEDPVDLSPVPGVAASWDISADGRHYTFHLRADARWSNGDPVTATDFRDSWQRVLSPQLAADYANLLYVLDGAEAYHRGETTDFTTVGVRAPDAHTLEVTLAYPAPFFLSLLQHWMWYPVHLPSIAAIGDPLDRTTPWARAETLVSNGPFQLTEWRRGERIVATRNPHYWDAATVTLNAIHFHPFEGVDTEERAFRAGQIHLTDALPVAKIDTYRRETPERLRIDPYLGTYFFRLNTTHDFLADPRVRQALNHATDRTAIVENILRGGQIPSAAYVPTGTGAGYQPPAGLTYNLATARALLADAGYSDGTNAPTIEILFNTSENHQLVAEALQAMWQRDLGLTVTLRNMENKTVLETRRTGGYDLLRSAWIADYNDPTSFLDVFRSDSGNNYTGWANADYDRLLDEATQASDPATRRSLLQQAETILLEDAPILPLFTYTHVFALHPSVQGWFPTLLDHHPYKHVSLKTSE
ncbi:peptide ABC transporter substrate-binding protein [Actomonas aquatica]|uniref:Peptide ABC transporter substrate-binding protein n=1 Tax=Actomonas aquatica TaxID=2866162 RepID=A0ABZ1CA66_9BACT|nr:peptide ABC transporter substrate-binding protein [Opitutus sp. WL0086]WRQ88572.1 peptide ABC transporter substrate-binding protein [Opitutus sp. WL0086]